MTRARAIEILTLWKSGAMFYTPQTINQALHATGDLN